MRTSSDPARPPSLSLWLATLLLAAVPPLAAAQQAAPQPAAAPPSQAAAIQPAVAENPLLADWQTPFQVPPFDLIKAEHFLPAFDAAMEAQRQEIAAIVVSDAPPTFANTVEALDD